MDSQTSSFVVFWSVLINLQSSVFIVRVESMIPADFFIKGHFFCSTWKQSESLYPPNVQLHKKLNGDKVKRGEEEGHKGHNIYTKKMLKEMKMSLMQTATH